MRNIIFALSLTIIATASHGAEMPKVYVRCVKCHEKPGSPFQKFGPDLGETKFTLDQFIKQVKNGSRWEGKPQRGFKFRSRAMPPQDGLTDEEIKLIYNYVRSK
ncbi:MAG: cytochrome c [Nitrospinae bacterium]|nr:cytochrome c [Nitrospinota bacterium]